MLQALINLFAGKKKEVEVEAPYKIEAPVVEVKPAPAKIKATKEQKPAVKAKTARKPKAPKA